MSIFDIIFTLAIVNVTILKFDLALATLLILFPFPLIAVSID